MRLLFFSQLGSNVAVCSKERIVVFCSPVVWELRDLRKSWKPSHCWEEQLNLWTSSGLQYKVATQSPTMQHQAYTSLSWIWYYPEGIKMYGDVSKLKASFLTGLVVIAFWSSVHRCFWITERHSPQWPAETPTLLVGIFFLGLGTVLYLGCIPDYWHTPVEWRIREELCCMAFWFFFSAREQHMGGHLHDNGAPQQNSGFAINRFDRELVGGSPWVAKWRGLRIRITLVVWISSNRMHMISCFLATLNMYLSLAQPSTDWVLPQ